MSGLALNLRKTVIIPLCTADPASWGERFLLSFPQWSGVQFASYGIYLGYAIGPAKGAFSWEKAEGKLLERARLWHETKSGLHIAARAYNTYGASTAAYVGQLEDPPTSTLAVERRALSLAA